MFPESSVGLDNVGVTEYKKSCFSGNLYESLLAELIPSDNRLTRDKIKNKFMTFLFAENADSKKWTGLFYDCFQKMYPMAHNLFIGLKKYNHNLLAILLQTIETYVVLEIIAKRFNKEFPNAPLFSIHDSLITTREYSEALNKIMLEELEHCFDQAATIKREEWLPENAIKS